MEYNITKTQAKIFLLAKHGLINQHKYNNVIEVIKDLTCIQYDPIDVCGRNADLVLQSRIKNYQKVSLYNELYQKRSLIDYWDKCMSIYVLEDWPYFKRIRDHFKIETRSKEDVEKIYQEVMERLENLEYASTKDLNLPTKVDWYWSETTLARAALETLYYRGDLVVHHKKGIIRYFALAKKIIDSDILDKSDPFQDDFSYYKWRVLRRIQSVGLLWNRPSDAFININLKVDLRKQIFSKLVEEKEIIEVKVEGVKHIFYISKKYKNLLDETISNMDFKKRCEFLAPLDNLLWDRKLIKELFNFDYTWEIYTPAAKRKYGYYCLPVLYGIDLIGRIELVADYKKEELIVKNIWYENSENRDKYSKNIDKKLEEFRIFNNVKTIRYEDK